MVKIRLMRVGKRKQPSFRVVVADSRSPRDGRIIESIGHYQPRQDPSVIKIDNERALYWLQKGAQASDSVKQLLRISGAWTDFTGEPQTTPLPGTDGEKVADAAVEATTAPKAAPKTARKKATPAASVTEGAETEEAPAETPAETPEAEDQQAAAPDAEPTEAE